MNTRTENLVEELPSGMLDDIKEIPEVLRKLYQVYVEGNHPGLTAAESLLNQSQPVVFTGMVTSEFAAYPSSILLNQAGFGNIIFEAAELLHYHLPILSKPYCLVAISQSGESAEIVHLLQALDGRVPVVGVYNDEESYLARHSTIGLPICAGKQRACGTKTNIATVATLNLLVEKILAKNSQSSGEILLRLADSLEQLLIGWEDKLKEATDFLSNAQDVIFLGRGPSYSSARFSAVLFREAAKSVSEGLSAASFRHGLMEMVRPEHRIVIFAPAGATHEITVRFASQLIEVGIPVMLVTNREVNLNNDHLLYILKTDPCAEHWAPILDMVPLQLIIYLLAQRMGLVPGKLSLASYVTRIE